MSNYFSELYGVDVSGHIEKKQGFSYVSWPFAVAELRKRHPDATWEVMRFDGMPFQITPAGCFVEVAVTVSGVRLSQVHPVLNGANKVIEQPNAFQINTSIQRCLVKAIALHGLGLYVYAGEDLPEEEAKPAPKLKIAALDGIGDALSTDTREIISEWAAEATEICRTQGAAECINFLQQRGMEGDERLYCDSKLPSDVRSAMRKLNQPKKEAA